MPANTGDAGAIHSVACFAGTPAPTGDRVKTAWLKQLAPKLMQKSYLF